MSRLKIMGTPGRLSQILSPWPGIKVRGGHTVVEDVPVKMQREMFNKLVIEHRFTAIDTSTPEAPKIVKDFKPGIQELTFLPQYTGG